MRNAVTIASTLLLLFVVQAASNSLQAASIEAPQLAQVKPATFRYWAAGEFTRAGKPVDAPQVEVRIRRLFSIMVHQVTVGEYRRCVADNACAPLADDSAKDNLPAVMVSWRDAQSYAAWLSRKLGAHYRLPTDEEWTYAAGSRAPDESPLGVGDAISRWVARYNRESKLQPSDPTPQPIGSFGANENGLLDIAGNVWEWTDTCFTRSVIEDGKPRAVTTNCGVRIAEGRHRAYISDFIRDARGGGCAVGLPPSNLGFRLVRDSKPYWWF